VLTSAAAMLPASISSPTSAFSFFFVSWIIRRFSRAVAIAGRRCPAHCVYWIGRLAQDLVPFCYPKLEKP
jgi:hypothetical protein